MGKCRRCGDEMCTIGRICPSCLNDWSIMRSEIFGVLQEIYGKLSPINHQLFIKETKRLESIWRKDRKKFRVELEALKINPK